MPLSPPRSFGFLELLSSQSVCLLEVSTRSPQLSNFINGSKKRPQETESPESTVGCSWNVMYLGMLRMYLTNLDGKLAPQTWLSLSFARCSLERDGTDRGCCLAGCRRHCLPGIPCTCEPNGSQPPWRQCASRHWHFQQRCGWHCSFGKLGRCGGHASVLLRDGI